MVGCVKSKKSRSSAAKDLYISPLFKGRRAYVEEHCDRWFILSAKHGLVEPDEVIEPYDVALATQSIPERRRWAADVVAAIREELGDLKGMTFEIHSGASYREFGLAADLVRLGANVENPVAGLSFGQQLAFYGEDSGGHNVTPPNSRSTKPSRYDAIAELLESLESNDLVVTFDQIEEAMESPLPASATGYQSWWANNENSPQSRDWVRRGWRSHHPRLDERTVGFRRSDIAQNSRFPIPATETPSSQISNSHRKDSPILNETDAEATVSALLEHAVVSKTRPEGVRVSYTPNAEANEMVLDDPFAFLIAVIFDQGITAERAWAAPYLLKQRLGYFDALRMSDDLEGVRRAIQEPPMLHRFKENMARWVVNAARLVVSEYGGDASKIWSDSPTATRLRERFSAFDGIGQKKAAMAVELLERDLGVVVRNLQGSDIAYDVHVRRVLLRTGLATRDDLNAMVNRTRELYPERPGSLDFPLWDIGRRWCRPQNPDCYNCPLVTVCPKFLDRTAQIKGVG